METIYYKDYIGFVEKSEIGRHYFLEIMLDDGEYEKLAEYCCKSISACKKQLKNYVDALKA